MLGCDHEYAAPDTVAGNRRGKERHEDDHIEHKDNGAEVLEPAGGVWKVVQEDRDDARSHVDGKE